MTTVIILPPRADYPITECTQAQAAAMQPRVYACTHGPICPWADDNRCPYRTAFLANDTDKPAPLPPCPIVRAVKAHKTTWCKLRSLPQFNR